MPVATAEGTTTARFAEERPGRGATLSATRPAVDLSPAVTKGEARSATSARGDARIKLPAWPGAGPAGRWGRPRRADTEREAYRSLGGGSRARDPRVRWRARTSRRGRRREVTQDLDDGKNTSTHKQDRGQENRSRVLFSDWLPVFDWKWRFLQKMALLIKNRSLALALAHLLSSASSLSASVLTFSAARSESASSSSTPSAARNARASTRLDASDS